MFKNHNSSNYHLLLIYFYFIKFNHFRNFKKMLVSSREIKQLIKFKIIQESLIDHILLKKIEGQPDKYINLLL